MTIKKAELRNALEAIANGFEGADIAGDGPTLADRSLKLACGALQWQIAADEYGNVKLVRSDLIETKDGVIDDAF